MTGGGYSLTGGFWALYAVQTPGAPLLTISFTAPNAATVAWPVTGSSGFLLQENTNLAGTNWVKSSASVLVSNGTNSVTVSPPSATRFFRLFHP